MRHWIIFGLVIMLAFVVVANLSGPRAWASDAHAPFMTVPTRTPKPSDTPTSRPTLPPSHDPTNTPAPAATNTPIVVQPSNTPVAAKTVTPPSAVTATDTSEPPNATPTATAAAIDQATATFALPAEAIPTATPEVTAAVVEATPTLDGSANVETVQIPPAAEQVSGATPADNSPSLWLLIIAVGLLIVGMIVLFGRRRKDNGK